MARPRRPALEISFGPDSEKAWEFLRSLAYDDKVRRALKENPQGVLRRYGIRAPKAAFGDPVRLPSKRQMQQIFEQIAPKADLKDPTAWPGGGPLGPPIFPTCFAWTLAFGAAASVARERQPRRSARQQRPSTRQRSSTRQQRRKK